MFLYVTVNTKTRGTSGKWPRKSYTRTKMETSSMFYQKYLMHFSFLSQTLFAKEIGPGHCPGGANSFLTVIERRLRLMPLCYWYFQESRRYLMIHYGILKVNRYPAVPEIYIWRWSIYNIHEFCTKPEYNGCNCEHGIFKCTFLNRHCCFHTSNLFSMVQCSHVTSGSADGLVPKWFKLLLVCTYMHGRHLLSN